MEVTLTPGYVICPPCSGLGEVRGPSAEHTMIRCVLCRGEGEIPDEVEDRFWHCLNVQKWGGPQRCVADLVGWTA